MDLDVKVIDLARDLLMTVILIAGPETRDRYVQKNTGAEAHDPS